MCYHPTNPTTRHKSKLMKRTQPNCTGVTRRGTPCRNPALPRTQPPRCRHHAGCTNTGTATAPAVAEPRNLTAELRLVRDVLSRLADRLDDPTYTLLPDEMRSLATLIFSGVRTVAYLIARQDDTAADLQTWLDQALDTLSGELSTDL